VIKNPKTYRDAIETLEGQYWKEAMDHYKAQILSGMWMHLVKAPHKDPRVRQSKIQTVVGCTR